MAKNYQVGLIIKGNAKGGVSAIKATKEELAQLNTKQKRFQHEASTSKASIGGMTKEFGLLKGVVAGVSFGLLANEVYRGIDAFQGYRGQLKTITGDFTSASKALDRLIALSKETPFTLAQSVEGFTKLTHLGLDPSRESMISYGNTAAAMGKDLMQMIEAVADASVGEFERLKEFGIKASSQGDNVRFTFQGTSTDIKKDAASIQQYLIDLGNNKFGDAMGDQMGRLSAKTSNLQTSFAQLYDGIGSQGAAGGVGGVIDTIALGVDSLAANVPAVISVVEILSVSIGGHLVAALARSGKGMLDNKIAAMGKLQANVQLQASELLLAKTANHKAVQEQLSAKRALAMAQTTYARTRAINSLALANGKAAAAERVLSVATNTNNVAMKRALVTSRLLGGSMALLGGPVGVAMLAGYALYEMTSGMKAAKTASEQLEAATGNTTKSIEAMTAAEQKQTASQYAKLIQSKQAKISALNKSIDDNIQRGSRSGSDAAFDLAKRQSESLELEKKGLENLMVAYSKVQGVLFDAGMATIEWTTRIEKGTQATASLSKASQSLIDRLNPLATTSRQFGVDMKQLHSSYLTGALNVQEYKQNVALLTQEYKNNTKAKESELSSDQKLIASLKEKVRLGGMSEAQKKAEVNLSQLSRGATDKQRKAVDKYTQSLIEQQRVQDETKQEEDFYQNAIEGVNGYAQAWSSAGNVIIDTFGSIDQQMEKLFTSQEAYTKAISINHKKQQAVGADIGQLKKEEYALNRASTHAEIQSYGSIAGAAASMFNEKSKAAKTFHAIEQMMAVASLAMSVQKMVMGTAETGVHVANESTKQGSNALTAITSAFAAPFPVGFVAGAAMIGIMASLMGGSFGSSGSAPPTSAQRQESQGTGTVLGSHDKSQSINNSFERLESLELDQYAELRDMNSSLRDLNNNITHLATSLVSNFGQFDADSYGGGLGKTSTTSKTEGFLIGGGLETLDPTGVVGKIMSSFSSTKKSVIDSGISIVSQTLGSVIDSGLLQAQQYFDVKTKKKKFWGASSKTSYNTEKTDINASLEHEMALIFGSIGHSVNSAVEVLGVDINNNLDNFVIDLPALSFKDLSGEEIQAELEAVFSSQADLMATHLVPGLIDFQKVGEGLFDTLVRLSQEQAIFNGVLAITGNSLGSIDATAQIDVAQSIIEFAGSVEALRDATSTYLSEFFSEEEQFSYLTNQLNEQFSALGTTLPATREAFKQVVSGLDLTTESDQRLYAQMMLLMPQMAQYYDALENQGDVLNDNAAHIKAFNSDITQQLAALDFTPLEGKLHALQAEFTQYYNNAQGADLSLLEELHGRKRQAIIDEALTGINTAHENAASKLIAENKKMAASIESLSKSIGASILSIQKQAAGWNEGDYQQSQITSLNATLLTQTQGTGSATEQIATIEQLKQAYVAKYQADFDGLNQNRDAAQTLHNEQLAQIEEQYQLELDIYNNMKSALLSLKDAADSLLLSDYSTLTNEQKLTEAQSQFEALFLSAQQGDVESLNKLSGVGDSYLKEAQQFYASGSDYSAIFDTVFNALNALGNDTLIAPVQQNTPELPSAIADYDKLLAALQKTTIESLTGLGRISQDVSLSVTTEFDTSMLVLNDKLEDNRLAVINNTVALKANPLPAASVDNSEVVQALADVKATLKAEFKTVLAAQSQKAEERIQQAQAQADAATERADKLIEAFEQSRRAHERQMDEYQDYNLRRSRP